MDPVTVTRAHLMSNWVKAWVFGYEIQEDDKFTRAEYRETTGLEMPDKCYTARELYFNVGSVIAIEERETWRGIWHEDSNRLFERPPILMLYFDQESLNRWGGDGVEVVFPDPEEARKLFE